MEQIAAVLMLLLASSCGTSKEATRTVQFCLAGEQDKEVFIGELKSIAAKDRMTFLDSSASTDRSLRDMGVHPGYPILHVGMEAPDGLGATAGNQGLGQYQVAIGFSGPDDKRAEAFSNQVVAALKKHWTVFQVPKGRGAFPLPNCGMVQPPSRSR
jgi:hypothetical protein